MFKSFDEQQYITFFAERLSFLREQKNVSAREMSLALGQNSSYINRIENKLNFPSMTLFFYICEYLEVSPKEFFDTDAPHPAMINEIISNLKDLDITQLDTVMAVAKGLNRK